MIKILYIFVVFLSFLSGSCGLKEITCISVHKRPQDSTKNDLKCYFNFDALGSGSEYVVMVDHSFTEGEDEHVKEIVFRIQNNFKLPSEVFHKFNNLEVLRIKPPGINNLPKIFENATNLVKMDLDFNSLVKLHSKTFNGAFNLRFLQLMGNKLRKIHADAFFGLWHLQFLYLQMNQLDSIHEFTFRPLTNLESLDLSQNKLEFLPENLFKSNGELSYLSLAYNKICVTTSTLFSHLQMLKVLNLSSNVCIDKLYETPKDNFTVIEYDLRFCSAPHE